MNKKLEYSLLDSPLLAWSFFVSVKLWKRLCLRKHKLAAELGIYTIDEDDNLYFKAYGK